MVARNESEAAHDEPDFAGAEGRSRDCHHADLQRAATDRLRRLDQARTGAPVVGAEVASGCRWWGATPTFVLAAATATWPGERRRPIRVLGTYTGRSHPTRGSSTPKISSPPRPVPWRTTAAVVITVTFEERDGKTHVVSHSLCPSKESARHDHRVWHGARYARIDGPARRARRAAGTVGRQGSE